MSSVLTALKTVEEKLSDNYSSYQLLSTLDTLLIRACEPIIRKTRFLDRHLGIMSGWYSSAARRKLASLPSKERFNSLVAAFMIGTPDDRILAWKALRLERSITIWLASQWLKELPKWKDAVDANNILERQTIERRLCFTDTTAIFQTFQEVDYWLTKAITFKQMLMEKYMRYAMREAASFYKYHRINNPHLQIDVDELAQTFCLSISKAIDKCDTDKGTLTSYINLWLQDARTNRPEYGTAFYIPGSKKKSIAQGTSNVNNISVSLDDEACQSIASDVNIEEQIESENIVNHVRRIAKSVDPKGFGRLALGISETLTLEELTLLRTACTVVV